MKGGLRFFGQITAMISHELKNSLAIMNENAGLLDDMLLMEQKGLPISSDRLKRLSNDFEKQIDRSNEIIKNLNCFAHSIDEPKNNISSADTIQLFIKVSQRLALLNKFEMNQNIDPDIHFTGNRFHLLNLLWRIIEKIVQSISDICRIEFTTDTENNGILINLTPNIYNSELNKSINESEEIRFLSDRINLKINFDQNTNTILLKL